MQIHDISVRNFRGIHRLEQLPCGRLNTLVGKNDAGKSSLIKALDAFFNKNFTAQDIFLGRETQAHTEVTLRFLPDLDLHPLALDQQGLLCLRKRFSFSETGRIQVEEFYTCHDINHPELGNCFGVKEADLNRYLGEVLGVKYTRSGREITNLSKIEEIEELSQKFGRSEKTYRAEDFLKNLEKSYPDFALPSFFSFDAEYNLDISHANFQRQFRHLSLASLEKNQNLAEHIEQEVSQDLSTEFDQITVFMQKNVPNLERIQPRITANWNNLVKFDLDLKFKEERYDVPITHKGTGFKRLLMVAYFEYLASKQTNKNQIFALEEPETYLHPSLQEDLLNSILSLAETSQFFLSTHSPIFAGATQKSNIVIVRKENSLSYYSNDEADVIRSVIDELGIQPDYNLLKTAKFIIFVEGKGDVHFIQSYAQTVMGRDLEADGIIVTIGGGSSLKNYADLDLFKKLSHGRGDQYAVLVDGDHDNTAKEKENEKIQAHCEADGAIYFKLSKKNIEHYCHPDCIQKIYLNSISQSSKAPHEQQLLRQYQSIAMVDGLGDFDVEAYLIENQLPNFKSSGKNIQVFQRMTQQEWQAMDQAGEIKDFLRQIYQRIA